MPHSPELTISRKADQDLSGSARRVVKATPAGGCALPAASTDVMLGVIYDKPRPAVGSSVGIIILGTAEAEAAAAFVVNTLLTADVNGRVLAAIAGNRIIGKALTAAGALGDIVEMQVLPGSQVF